MRNQPTTFAIYAVPVALLMMAGGLASPSASADTNNNRQTVSGVFAYDRHAPAETNYARLHRTAEKLCMVQPGPRPIELRKHEAQCVAGVVADGVSRIGRTDLAAVHGRARG